MLVLLASVVTGAVAQTTYKVSVKDGTEDATSWTIAPAEVTTTGVAAGTTVTATYSGAKKVKSVKAVKKEAVGNIVDLSTISGTSYTVTEDVILTGTPNNNLTIGYSADNWEVTLDNVNPSGTRQVKISSNRHVNLKLKGTSRLTQIFANNNKNVTIDKAADDGTLILQIGGSDSPLDVFGTVYIKGGTVKARCTGYMPAVYSNLNISGGAVYLAGGTAAKAVHYNVTGTLYGWNGSGWGNYSSQQYATTDNTSGNPSSWTW